MRATKSTPHRGTRRHWPWIVGGLVALSVIGVFLLWGFTRPLRVTVDGTIRTVPAGSTLSDLQDQGMLHAERGALLSVEGKVLRRFGGASGIVTRNGRPVSLEERLFDGDVVASRRGANTREAKVTRRESLPIAIVQEGTGPVIALRRLGTPGVVVVTTGRISGIESTRSVIASGDPMVVVRRPASSSDKLVALTFDDGPWPGQTDKILDILKKNNIHATFFMLGRQARKSPQLVRRAAAEGNAVGSHSQSHAQLTKLKPPAIRKEIAGGVSAVGAATGVRPVWFRPPYGATNAAVRKAARAVKVNIALWEIDTLDWTRPGAHTIYRNAVRSTKPGQIVLMHDGGGDRAQTIKALPTIIDDLRSKGFTFVTLDELTAAR